ncbi:hypothetical protein H6G69_17725 [Nostoc sp. FACHB-110]|nr:hypothetical protein [Nostoc sp. FACHB-110]
MKQAHFSNISQSLTIPGFENVQIESFNELSGNFSGGVEVLLRLNLFVVKFTRP